MSLQKEKSPVQEQIESLSIHGLSKIASAKSKCARITWLVMFISAATSLGFAAFDSFMNYFQFDTFSHTSIRQNSQLALPGITFCHTNFYSPKAYNNEEPPVPQKLPENCSFNDSRYFANENNWKIFQLGCKMFIGTFKSKTSGMGSEIPQYFQFPTGFEITPHTLPCITLNRNLTLVQQSEGEKYGLHMIMYNEYYNVPFSSYSDEPLRDSRNGILVMMHDQRQLVPIGDGIVIPPGYHTRISVSRNVLKRLPDPYPSKCTNDWSSPGSIYPGKNTLHMCYASCGIKQLYKICPGVIPEMKVFMKAPEFPVQANISNSSFWKCIEINLSRLDFLQCDCRKQCNEETYTTVTNRSPWPQNWQAPSFLKLINRIEEKNNSGLSTNNIRERLIKVSIYYENFREHISEERPLYSFSTITGDLGGQMGLFMGASLLSLAEIIALFATCFKKHQSNHSKAIEVSPERIN